MCFSIAGHSSSACRAVLAHARSRDTCGALLRHGTSEVRCWAESGRVTVLSCLYLAGRGLAMPLAGDVGLLQLIGACLTDGPRPPCALPGSSACPFLVCQMVGASTHLFDNVQQPYVVCVVLSHSWSQFKCLPSCFGTREVQGDLSLNPKLWCFATSWHV